MTSAVTIVLKAQSEGWTWLVQRDEEWLGEGRAANGDAALAAARSVLEACLVKGLEADFCEPHWRRSSILLRLRP